MTILVARPPLYDLSMSAMQSGTRRLSARLQEKDGGQPYDRSGSSSAVASKSQPSAKKRKNDYEEDDDGFAFTRVKKTRNTRQTTDVASKPTQSDPPPVRSEPRAKPVTEKRKPAPKLESTTTEAPKRKRNRLSFSTPKAKDPQPARRSKRLSTDVCERNGSPEPPVEQQLSRKKRTADGEIKQQVRPQDQSINGEDEECHSTIKTTDAEPNDEHSATKIALPFADTPVIRRNKAMREGRGSKGDRRSSLGLRGRRASSLIDTGNSSALPHQEVETKDFYKHIESDLMEPRRMRQLLTWSATRAMHAKPKGTDFEDASAKSAARVIEEELLQELANKAELSDWFSRDNVQHVVEPLPERPNPKNVQNNEKIAQLEEQIQRLRVEKQALEELLRPPEIVKLTSNSTDPKSSSSSIDTDLLSPEDAELLSALDSTADYDGQVGQRLHVLVSSLGPTVDMFADSIHKIAQYRDAADGIASSVLAICAEKLAHREREGRKKALHTEEDRSPGRDLSSVLRGLSRADK